MIIAVDTGNTSDRIQHPFLILKTTTQNVQQIRNRESPKLDEAHLKKTYSL